MDGNLEIIRVQANELTAAVDELANLRIEVFREYPYLYDGSHEYERRYLQTYCQSPQALAILVKDIQSGRIVGASTGVPLAHESEEFKAPFVDRGFDPENYFYCGESVLLQEYRGRGIYRQFFLQREAFARRLGKPTVCFCAIVRPADHPLRPEVYQPLDDIWRHFGYRLLEGVTTYYPWKELGQEEESDHLMQFWHKEL